MLHSVPNRSEDWHSFANGAREAARVPDDEVARAMQPLLDAAAGFEDLPKVREIIGERRARLDPWRSDFISTRSGVGCSPPWAA